MGRFLEKNGKYLLFAAEAALFLLLASRSSFLYPFNNWDDANSYLSMGKALFHGKVLYREVFDQKGMYLYFLYGLAYLVSHTTFAGVYLLEIALGTADIIGFYRIIRLYAGRMDARTEKGMKSGRLGEAFSIVLAPVSYAVLLCSRSFWWGGAAEEICLPFVIWGLYLSLSYFKKEYPQKAMPYRTVFIGGILAGIIANIKFTLLGFFFSWMLFAGLSFLLAPVPGETSGEAPAVKMKNRFLSALRACGIFLLGMFVPFVPWIVYFGVHHALYDWYWGYVYVNVFVYREAENMGDGFLEKCVALAKILYNLMRTNWQYFVLVIPGLLYAALEGGIRILARFNVLCLFGFLYLGIFIGGRELPYYSLPLAVFAVLGCAMLAGIFTGLFGSSRKKARENSSGSRSALITAAASVLITALGMVFTWNVSMNIPFMKQEKDDFFLYRFRDEVLEKEDPTLLNVGCLDAGLYTLCDIVPNCRYFQTQTLHIENKSLDPYCEQERYIEEGLTDFVISRGEAANEIEDRYDLIDTAEYSWEDLTFTYYLYKLRDED